MAQQDVALASRGLDHLLNDEPQPEEMMKRSRQIFIASLLAITLIVALGAASASPNTTQAGSNNAFQELVDQSLKDKKGLTFFIKGQTVGGAVIKQTGPDIIEVRNQTYSRIIIRLDQVDAVAIN